MEMGYNYRRYFDGAIISLPLWLFASYLPVEWGHKIQFELVRLVGTTFQSKKN
jgi:hypothetical protein